MEPAARINGVSIDTCIMYADRATGGGDWCEAFALGEERVALSVGDVCGHGIKKMPPMAALRGCLHEALVLGRQPDAALEEANRFLRAYDPDENATALIGILDLGRRSLTFVNAGHPPPLLAGPYEATFLTFAESDVPLGVCATIQPSTHVVSLAASTLLVLYTDGVSEHDRDPLTGSAELYVAAIAAHALPATPSASYLQAQLALDGENRDDAAILTVRMPNAPIRRRRSTAIRGRESTRVCA